MSITFYENKLLRSIIFLCSLKDLSLVYRLWKFQFPLCCTVWSTDIKCFPEYLEPQIPHSSSLALHLLIRKRILGTSWPLLLPKGCVPRRQTHVVSWLYRLGWAGAKGLHRVLWGGMEKKPQSLTSSKLGKSWLDVDSPALLLKQLAQFILYRIEIFVCAYVWLNDYL